MLAGIEEKRMSRNRPIKICIFLSAATHVYDYTKPLLKNNPNNIILHIETNNLENTKSRV